MSRAGEPREQALCSCGPGRSDPIPGGRPRRCYPQQFDGGSWLDSAQLLAVVDALKDRTVAVIGDIVADEFVYGRVARVSREAPVLILEYDSTEVVPGAGGNAANNVAALGGRPFSPASWAVMSPPAGWRLPWTRASIIAVSCALRSTTRRSRHEFWPAASTRPSSRWCGSIAR